MLTPRIEELASIIPEAVAIMLIVEGLTLTYPASTALALACAAAQLAQIEVEEGGYNRRLVAERDQYLEACGGVTGPAARDAHCAALETLRSDPAARAEARAAIASVYGDRELPAICWIVYVAGHPDCDDIQHVLLRSPDGKYHPKPPPTADEAFEELVSLINQARRLAELVPKERLDFPKALGDQLARMSNYQAAILPFVRAIHAWQWAMTGAAAPPDPRPLLPVVRLLDAAFDVNAAREWANEIGAVLAGTETMIAEARPTTDAGRREIEKWRGLVGYLRDAHRCALEHVATFR